MAASKSHTARNLGIAFLALVVLLVGGGAVGVYAYSDRAKPGVFVAGQDVAGKTGVELAGVVRSLVDSFQLTLTTPTGQSVAAKPADLGLAFDQAATIQQAVSGTPGMNTLALYSPWQTKNVPLVYTIDEAKAQQFIDEQLMPASEPKDAGVSYDQKAAQYVVTPGAIGQAGNLADVKNAIAGLAAGQPTGQVTVSDVPRPPQISDDMANKAAASANAALKLKLKFTGPSGSYTVPAASIVSWTSFTPADGTLGVVYDQAAIAKDLPPAITEKVVRAPVNETYLTAPNGRRIARSVAGSSGAVLTDAAVQKAVTSTATALQTGKAFTQKVETKKAKYKTVEKVVPHNYGVPNGDKWIEVDLTHQRTTLYLGTTKVKTYVIASGKRPLVTTAGTWYVWYKTPMQDMKGPGYLAKDVRWISFFHNGEGFHAAPWVSNFGVPHSHGCINMTTGAAKELFDWAPLGTMVKVHGTTP